MYYRLNDLPIDDPKKRPNVWTKHDGTRNLVEALKRNGYPEPIRTVAGSARNKVGGTYVVRELQLAYALWADPNVYIELVKEMEPLV
jgi:hypothetical protein